MADLDQNNADQNNADQANTNQANTNQDNTNQANANQNNTNQANANQNNTNQDGSNDNNVTNNQNQFNKVPEYSFWAEQVPGSSYTNSNPNSNPLGYANQNGNPNYYGNQNYGNNGNNSNQNQKERKGNRTGGKVFKFIAKSVCFGLIAGISFFGVQKMYYAINPDAASNSIFEHSSTGYNYEIGYTKAGIVKTVDDSTISDVAGATLPAIVSINSTLTQTTQWFGQSLDQQVEGSGSGIIVGKDEKELLIATNNHVVEGTDKITVTFADGSQADAIIKGTDATADLAVVTVDITKLTSDTLKAITVAKLGNSDDSKVGEMVIAIGNALGYGQSVTVGYISAKDRNVEVSDGYTSKTMVLLQTDAAINPGNSGGALINMKGEVIGINTVKYASDEVEGMGYAIPITKATPIITELMKREILSEAEQGYLGISGTDVTEDVAAYYNMPVGVYIKEVADGGAAAKSGLKADDIITNADDLKVSSISQLREYVNSLKVGTKVEITYMRNTNGTYEEGKATVTLGKNPNLTETTK